MSTFYHVCYTSIKWNSLYGGSQGWPRCSQWGSKDCQLLTQKPWPPTPKRLVLEWFWARLDPSILSKFLQQTRQNILWALKETPSSICNILLLILSLKLTSTCHQHFSCHAPWSISVYTHLLPRDAKQTSSPILQMKKHRSRSPTQGQPGSMGWPHLPKPDPPQSHTASRLETRGAPRPRGRALLRVPGWSAAALHTRPCSFTQPRNPLTIHWPALQGSMVITGEKCRPDS